MCLLCCAYLCVVSGGASGLVRCGMHAIVTLVELCMRIGVSACFSLTASMFTEHERGTHG